MGDIAVVTELGRGALMIAMELALPILAIGLVVGLLVSLFQALTQVQEQTLSFIPKIFAMAGAIVLLLPWLLSVMTEYMQETLGSLSTFGSP